ncbi:MAG: hypothetical protein JWN90_288, partial [Parcubacteria group bacterium]|nr:hypothetical protein [Parcubacteria group bacterium]
MLREVEGTVQKDRTLMCVVRLTWYQDRVEHVVIDAICHAEGEEASDEDAENRDDNLLRSGHGWL